MRHLFGLLVIAFTVFVFASGCSVTGPGCANKDVAVAENEEDADSDNADDPCPTGLSCNEHGGCNTDYPHCCNGACQKNPCSSAGHP